jgi:hypothetical protein
MIHFKNKSGFGLLEAVVSMVIVAFVMTPLLMMQGSIVERVGGYSRRMLHMFYAKNFLCDTRQTFKADTTQTTAEKIMTDPAIKMTYVREPVSFASSLKSCKGLCREQVTTSWQVGRRSVRDVLVSFVWVQETDKKEGT